jgi:uncharacterized protein YyaL (SSP411 family)
VSRRNRLGPSRLLGPIALAAAFAPWSLAQAPAAAGHNHLGSEKSPYLRQHALNPVWWWTWTPDALAEARKEGKPIFLSVGYSTCHWCHVMERESFTQADVAKVLNESFVAIKVDREERPDVDEVYMQSVVALTGNGGWPLTVLLTPDGRPFFGGTYFPHDKLVQLLGRVAADWTKDRTKAEAMGAKLSQSLARTMQREASGNLEDATLVRFGKAFERWFDAKNGGFLGAPKFPPAYALRLLLRLHRRSGDPHALEMVTRTLDAMARGGIYDHVGGGFHRYATDDRWQVPHFEKMLYDQAALVQAYVEAFAATGNPEYARVVREVLDYVLRDMTHPDGGFFSAEDADSEGEEGRFYVWTEAQLRQALDPASFERARAALGVTPAGNFAGGANVLHRAPSSAKAEDDAKVAAVLAVLRQARERRTRPARDEKVLADWNGLMVAAMAKAGRVLQEPRYVEGAARAARFTLARLRRPDGTLQHRWSAGEAGYTGNLDDYVFQIEGLIELFEADFDRRWLDEASALQKVVESRFRAPQGNYYFTDGSDPSLLVREVRTADNVVPAGNSVAALNLLRLADLLLDQEAAARARAILAATPREVKEAPDGYPVLLIALDYASDRSKEIAVVGDPHAPATLALVAAVRAGFNPNLVLAAGSSAPGAAPLLLGKPLRNEQPTAYVCEAQVCRAPTNDPKVAAELAQTYRPLPR